MPVRESGKKLLLAAKLGISLVYLLLWIVPCGKVWRAGDTEAFSGWAYTYVWKDELTAILFLPFVFIWIPYLLLRPNKLKLFLGLLLILASFLYALLGMAGMVFISQDYSPHIGSLLGLLLPFPMLYLYVEDRNAYRNS